MHAQTGAEPSKGGRRFALRHNRDYLLLWSGQTVSLVGTQVSSIEFPLLILAITHSPVQAGAAYALRSLPYIVLSLPVGALIDRWDRKRVMILCDSGRALALGSIPVALALGRLTIWQLYVAALVEGTLFVFFNLAEVACLPRVVTPEQLPVATARNNATEGISGLVGPSLSGALYTTARALPFAADSLSYVASVISLLFVRAACQAERATRQRALRAQIGEGFSWLWSHPLIRYLAFLTGGLNFIWAGAPLIVILLAQRQGASPAVIGLIFAIGGAGSIVGAVVAPAVRRRFSFRQVIVGTMWLTALLWPLYAIAPNPLLLGVVTAALFLVGPMYDVMQFSYRLSLIPDELQGRVNSVFRLLAFGFQPLGAGLTGVLLQTISPAPTVLALFVVLLALAWLTSVNQHVRAAQAITVSAR